MKKLFLSMICFLSACAQDPYRLKIDSSLAEAHGQSIYFRSSLRSSYAGQIRRVLSNKFGEIGMKTATSTDNADFIAIFDIETFYKQDADYKDATYANTSSGVLFSGDENASSQYYSGNANLQTNRDQTCFTLYIGRKDTSRVSYASIFCADTIYETEDFLPYVLDVYGKYATYASANTGVQCLSDSNGLISCAPVHDRQQAFINSLWIDREISD
ncbi:MAG: hypothetical protein Q4D80_06710 [Pseudomonadota bacterium]|nr:hypothetical protein [Pseudomonadota bacterium]